MQYNLMYNTNAHDPSLDFLKLIAHDVRRQLVTELARSDRRVGELTALTGRPQNLVSYHLGLLRDGALVREQRSAADGRDVYYSLDVDRLETLYHESGRALHPVLAGSPVPAGPLRAGEMRRGAPERVLFLCTHNSARSQMAEALLRATAGDAVDVASAGSEPAGVHPLAVQVMAERGIDISDRRAKHMDALLSERWDRVITVCDRVREVCPVLPAGVVTAHWSVRDPAAVIGTAEVRLSAFQAAADELAGRVRHLLPLILGD